SSPAIACAGTQTTFSPTRRRPLAASISLTVPAITNDSPRSSRWPVAPVGDVGGLVVGDAGSDVSAGGWLLRTIPPGPSSPLARPVALRPPEIAREPMCNLRAAGPRRLSTDRRNGALAAREGQHLGRGGVARALHNPRSRATECKGPRVGRG